MTRRWKPFVKDARPDIEMVLKANHVRLKNEDKAALVLTEDLSIKFQAFWAEHAHHPLRARDHIVRSFCPGLSGLCKVKLSLLLTLIGGVPRVDGSGAAHPSFARSAPRPAWLPSRKSNGGGCAR